MVYKYSLSIAVLGLTLVLIGIDMSLREGLFHGHYINNILFLFSLLYIVLFSISFMKNSRLLFLVIFILCLLVG